MTDVLIVEDIAIQRSLLEGFLSGVHDIVGTAETAAEAVALARETDPGAVVMDLNLAEGNGLDATRRIKALDSEIQIVVSTVTVSQETEQAAFEAGADAYLSKPYSQDDLLDAIESRDD